MIIGIANDHGGYHLKTAIVHALKEAGVTIVDFGTKNAFESADYPDYAKVVCEKMIAGKITRGILVCGTGIGMSMAANKYPGIRAALVHDVFSAVATREHNDSNVLCLGERVIGEGLALKIVDIWLNTAFLGGRHERRLQKVAEVEQVYSGIQ